MSIPNGYVRCHGCAFEGVLLHRPIRLEYRLSTGKTVEGYRCFAWCATCCQITLAEDLADLSSIQADMKSIEHRNRGIIQRLFGFSREDSEKMKSLKTKLRLVQARQSPPRCLRCEEPTVTPLKFDSHGASSVMHSCGQRLFRAPENPDAPRFLFKPELIRLDAEGRRI